GLLETENGNSDLVKKSNNHFGIKCKTNWTGDVVSHDDDAPGECFRSYKYPEDSYRDHSDFLRNSQRYAFLFNIDPKDYKAWAYGLKRAGYATNPRYPDILIKNIEQNNLQQYTLVGEDDMPIFKNTPLAEDVASKYIALNTSIENTATDNIDFDKQIFINDKPAVMCRKGTSLLALATTYNINLAKLLEYNDLTADGLLPQDQLIFLEKKAKQGNADIYTTQKNISLYDVSQSSGIRLENLKEYNPAIKNGYVIAGTKVSLRPGEEPVKEEEVSAKEIIHEVQPKEGLYTISKKYGVSVDQLKSLNNLPDDKLKVGQQLIISK
ncbi:MAG: glucosaminidase domain-containing protein, partial [Ferruginibacter sp.]